MNEKTSHALSTLGLLGVAFVTLKLCGVIEWSWWWVTAPFWGLWALIALLLIGLFSLAVVRSGFGFLWQMASTPILWLRRRFSSRHSTMNSQS